MSNWERFKSGETGLFPPKNWADFIAAIASLEITSFVGGKFSRTVSTTLEATPGVAGGAGSPPKPFQIIDASNGDDGARVRIVGSTLAGDLPDGFSAGDDPAYYLPVADGDKIILYVETDAGGTVITRSIFAQPDLDADSDTEFEAVLGSVAVDSSGDVPVVTCSNAGYGPVAFVRCRDWFAEPPVYHATWTFQAS